MGFQFASNARRRAAAAAVLFLSFLPTARAAQQCFTTAGVYGAVTITESAGCQPINGVAGRDGFLVQNNTCVIGFNHGIATSSVTIEIDGNDPTNVTQLATSGGNYTALPADIAAPLVPAFYAGTVAVAGGTITGMGSGQFAFTGAVPSVISSLSITQTAPPGLATFYRVCVDDAAAAFPGSVAAAVPASSPWSLLGLFVLMTWLAATKRRSESG